MPHAISPGIFLLRCLSAIMGLVLFLATWTGCATLEQIIQKPTATFKGFQLTDPSLMQGTAVFDFDVTNPNPIGISAHRIHYDLQLNGQNFVSGQLNKGLSLPASGTGRMRIPVTIQYLDFFKSVDQLLQNKSTDYLLKGGFSVGPFTIPFQAKGSFSLPQMPKISLDSIQIKNYSLSGASLSCKLNLDNPNAFNLLFKRLDYNLKLGGTQFAKASALPSGPIAGNGQSLINLGMDVSFAQLGLTAYRLLQKSKTDYSLNGGIVFDTPAGGERLVPFNLSGQVPFFR